MNLPAEYLGAEDVAGMWEYVEWFLGVNQMWIMMILAFTLAGTIAGMIVNLFTPKREDEDFDYED